LNTGTFRFFYLALILIINTPTLAQTEVEGEVSGTWNMEGSPYTAISEISLALDDTLLIESGVEINFRENIIFFVSGHLSAEGSSEDSIRFTAAEEQFRWGGIRMLEANDCLLDYCVITGGQALQGEGELDSLGSGGNIFIAGGTVSITNSRISGGVARSLGGGIAVWRASPTISNCILSENQSNFIGGGIGIIFQSEPIIDNCELIGNFNGQGGGAAFIANESIPIFTNCNFTENQTRGEGGDGGACYINTGSDPVFEYCVFTSNESVDAGGAVYIRGEGADAIFDHCIFTNNTITAGDYSGGAVFIRDGAAGEIKYCQFIENVSDRGGAIYVRGNPLVSLHHNIFRDNGARIGGAVAISHDNPEQPLIIENCTFVGQYYTGLNPVPVTVMTRGDSRIIIKSSIIQDLSPRFPEEGVRVLYSHVLEGYEGEGNSDEDPLFHLTGTGYYLLRGDSPCRDSGEPELPLDPDSTRNDRGWIYVPSDAMEGFQQESVTASLTTIDRDTVSIRFRNNTQVPIAVTPMEFWTEPEHDELFNVSELTNDFEIHGAALVGDDIFISGGNSGDDPNKIYKLDKDFNLQGQFDQPGDRGGVGYLDLATDGGAVIYGGNDRQVVEFTTNGEVGDPYDAPDQLDYITNLSADFSNAHEDVDFYLSADDNIIYRADGNMWVRDSMVVGAPIRGLGTRQNIRAVYGITEPTAGNPNLNLFFPDDDMRKQIYPLSVLEGYQFGGFEITQNWEQGFGTLIGIMKGEEDNGDMLLIENVYISWLIIIPELKFLMPGESAEWNVTFAGDQMPAGMYEAEFFMKINGIGEGNEVIADMDLQQSSVQEGENNVPFSFGLNSIYPNPFNSVAKFWYSLPNSDHVRILLTDAAGRKICNLIDMEHLPGRYSGTIQGRDLPSGEYFLKMTTSSNAYVLPAILMK